MRLHKEKTARIHWRKLYTMIQIVKALSARESEQMRNRGKFALDDDEEEE